ncbi:MAG: glycosyltransferase family 39 protein [Candidatus Pacebacteria bacterium]|nr:glycosyltransferase family 39 protein [Candidatus Paceibacterota bacterium]
MNNYRRGILLLILVLAFLLRIWQVGQNPAGFFCDEAAIGYNAYSLLTTGRDEYGVAWPIFFKSFGEYKNPVMIYSSLPLIAVFGLGEFAVRLTSVIYGTLTVLAVFWLGRILMGEKGGLFSAAFLAICPWHIHLSRVSLEGLMPLVFFTTLGFYFWIKAQTDSRFWFGTMINFGLAAYSYFPARIFIPPFLGGLLLISLKEIFHHWRRAFSAGFLFLLICLPLIRHILFGSGMARWQQVSVFAQKTSLEAWTQVSSNYLAHFSADFLFRKGDIDFPGQFITRHSIRGMGEFYYFQAPLMFLGLVWLLINQKRSGFFPLLWWLAIYPLGSALSLSPGPQATRSVVGILPLVILTAAGVLLIEDLVGRIKKFKLKRLFTTVWRSVILIVILTAVYKFINLYRQYPLYASDFWGWQFGPREITGYFLKNKKSYDELVMSSYFNAPGIFLKFYGQNQCRQCRVGGLALYNPNKKQLFALRPEELNQLEPGDGFLVEKEIFYPNNELAFTIGRVVPESF